MTSNHQLLIWFQLIFDKKFVLTVLVLCLCNVIIYKAIFFNSTNTTDVFVEEFPSQISNWTAKDVVYDPEILKSLDPDKIVYKTYFSNGNPPITLFMACYNTLEKADLSHSPIVCFTGQGWEITHSKEKKILVDHAQSQKIKVNQTIQNKENATIVAIYWYQSRNGAHSNRGIQKIYLFFAKLFGKPDGNAFVRLTLRLPEGMPIENAQFHLNDFVLKLYPKLRRYFI